MATYVVSEDARPLMLIAQGGLEHFYFRNNAMSHVSVSELMELGAKFEGSYIEVRGLICVRGDVAFIELGESKKIRLPIIDPAFLDKLLDVAAVRLGGYYLFHDQGSIKGRYQLNNGGVDVVSVESGTLASEFTTAVFLQAQDRVVRAGDRRFELVQLPSLRFSG